MDNHYYILFALFIMGLIGFVSVIVPDGELVSSAELAAKLRINVDAGILYDSGGHAVCYYNMSKIVGADNGHVVFYDWGEHGAFWRNGTLGATSDYRLYADTSGKAALSRDDFGVNGFETTEYMRGFAGVSDGFVGSLWMNMMAGAFVAIVVGAVAGAALLSVNVLGSGEQEYGTRTIVTIGFYSLLWVLVSAVGVASLTSIPFFGWVFYGLLSFGYYLGVWGEVNN